MTRAAALLAMFAIAGCATSAPEPPPLTCPAGKEPLRTAQLLFGRHIADQPAVSEADFQAFVEEELTPRFPQGLTVLSGGRQWRTGDAGALAEASKAVVIVLPQKGSDRLLNEVRSRYKARFHQDAVLVVVQDACVELES